MNEYKYFEEMLLTDVDAVSIYCLISHGEGESPRIELFLSTITPISSMSAYESDKKKCHSKLKTMCLNTVPLVMDEEGSHQEQIGPFIQLTQWVHMNLIKKCHSTLCLNTVLLAVEEAHQELIVLWR